jgi:hypothetical protein
LSIWKMEAYRVVFVPWLPIQTVTFLEENDDHVIVKNTCNSCPFPFPENPRLAIIGQTEFGLHISIISWVLFLWFTRFCSDQASNFFWVQRSLIHRTTTWTHYSDYTVLRFLWKEP